ncbi:glycoside hydrolase family 32 protein [Microbacterium sp. cf046]|uniref:glycoside hydrolase family 32 protein n=1 Tax=Microbacterium sp. cf046 TaxID=1761803 RepID=UPI001C317603|nr:glycoside hydrolase family 32 protein [Microbacterium sp. cf046]
MITRPRFHFTAASGWINDPHGITFRDGRYHTFFQYLPGRTDWAPDCRWGHASGEDLFSLTELPVALAPGGGDGGIWTGALVRDDDGKTRVFYTSTSQPDIGIGRIRLAAPADEDWITWKKGPFVAEAPAGLELVAYRDPFLRHDPDGWRMFVGAGDSRGTAMALSYHSDDLEAWQYEGVALERSRHETADVWMGALWECPQIIDVDGHAVMLSSVWEGDVLYYAGYAIGEYEAGVFTAQHWGRLTYGDSYYAPSFFRDDRGHPCITMWMRGVADFEAGWAGAHSIPYVLSVVNSALVATPHSDLERYRSADGVGQINGLAADIAWVPDSGELTVTSGGRPVVVLTATEDGDLRVTTADADTVVPVSGDVRLIVDGPVVEISSAAGLIGAAVAPSGDDLVVKVGGNPAMIAHALAP